MYWYAGSLDFGFCESKASRRSIPANPSAIASHTCPDVVQDRGFESQSPIFSSLDVFDAVVARHPLLNWHVSIFRVFHFKTHTQENSVGTTSALHAVIAKSGKDVVLPSYFVWNRLLFRPELRIGKFSTRNTMRNCMRLARYRLGLCILGFPA